MKAFLNKYIVKIYIAFFTFNIIVIPTQYYFEVHHLWAMCLAMLDIVGIGILLQLLIFLANIFLGIFTNVITEKSTHRWCLVFIVINSILILLEIGQFLPHPHK